MNSASSISSSDLSFLSWRQSLTYSRFFNVKLRLYLSSTFFSNPGLHARAANLVRNLLTSHDFDSRYSNPACKARVAGLYLPFISVLLDALPHLYDWSIEGKGNRLEFVFTCKKAPQHRAKCRRISRGSDVRAQMIVGPLWG